MSKTVKSVKRNTIDAMKKDLDRLRQHSPDEIALSEAFEELKPLLTELRDLGYTEKQLATHLEQYVPGLTPAALRAYTSGKRVGRPKSERNTDNSQAYMLPTGAL